MVQSSSTTPALSSLNGKPILLNFDGAENNSDVALMREGERQGGVEGTGQVAKDPRDPGEVRNGRDGLEEIRRLRITMGSAEGDDANDVGDVREYPVFKEGVEGDGDTVCSQRSQSRDSRTDKRALMRMAHGMVQVFGGLYGPASRQVALDIVVAIDAILGAVQGHHQFHPFYAEYDEYPFEPIDGVGRVMGAVQLQARAPHVAGAATSLRRIFRGSAARAARTRP